MGKYVEMHERAMAKGPHRRGSAGRSPEWHFGMALCVAVALAIVFGPLLDILGV